jgi:hypothetical protein
MKFWHKADAEQFMKQQKGDWYMKFKNLHWWVIQKD